MRAILFAIAVSMPLAATAATSEFDSPRLLIAATLALGYALHARGRGLGDLVARRRSLGIATAALTIVGITSVCTAWSTDPQAALVDAVRLMLPALLVILAAHHAGTTGRWPVDVAVAAAPALALIVQWGLDRDLLWDIPHRAGVWTSSFGNSALMGEAAVVGLGGCLALAGRAPITATLLAIPATTLIVASDSRGAWLAGATCLALWTVLELAARLRVRTVLPIAGVVVLGAIAIGAALPADAFRASVAERLASITDPSHPTNRVRSGLATAAVELGRGAPLVGIGGGRFAAEHFSVRDVDEWAISGLESRADDPHAEYLRFFCEYGALGAVLIGGVLVALVVALFRRRMESSARAALATWGGILLMAFVWGTFRHPATTIPLALLTGVALRSGSEPGARGGRDLGVLILLGACVVIAGLHVERDSAAVALRDRAERLKRSLVEADEARAPGIAGDLGLAADGMSAIVTSSWLTPPLRQRLLVTLENLAAQRLAAETGGAGRRSTPMTNALRTWPDAAAVRSAIAEQLERVPAHPGARRLLARIEALDGRKFEAVSTLEALIRDCPNDPHARRTLAALHIEGETALYARALPHLDAHLEIWGSHAEAADDAWELRARCLGAEGRIGAALESVEEWIERLGESPVRRAVGGEISLHLGESPATVGTFTANRETWGARQERGAFTAARLDGLPDQDAVLALLAHLGRHPHDTPALDALRDRLGTLARADEGNAARLERMRDRVIARSRIHYAWENHLLGDERNFRTCLRIARRKSAASGDTYFLRILHDALAGRYEAAVAELARWREAGFDSFPALQARAELSDFLALPETRRLLAR